MILAHKNGISYEILGDLHTHAAVECLSRMFSEHEPMVLHLGITPQEIRPFVESLLAHVLGQGLCIAALDTTTQQLVGCTVIRDFARPLPEDLGATCPILAPVMALLDQLEAMLPDELVSKPGETAHFFMIAVLPEFAGRGIASTLQALSLERSLDLGYRKIVTEPTGRISQHLLLEKCGYQKMGEITYDSFTYEGTRPFAGLLEPPTCMLFMGSLPENPNKDDLIN